MKNFFIVLLMIAIILGTGYGVYYQVDKFNHKNDMIQEGQNNHKYVKVSCDSNQNCYKELEENGFKVVVHSKENSVGFSLEINDSMVIKDSNLVL